MSMDIDWDAYLDSVSTALGLPIPVDYRPLVIANLRQSAGIAALFLDFPLPDDSAAAAIFRPGAP